MSEPLPSIRYEHTPVLAHAVVSAFNFQRPSVVIDGTLGLGGHSEWLLKEYADMRVLGFDWDTKALQLASARLAVFGSRFRAIEGSYAATRDWLNAEKIESVDGVLLDLGLSSMQLSDSARGFSFLRPGPLDMRMSHSLPRTAWEVIHQWDEAQLTDLFRKWGEEPHAKRIARALKQAIRQKSLVNDALAVATCIRQALPSRFGGIDPATKSFQALRIVVNGELDNVDRILSQLPKVLRSGGRAAIISFHSLEDRRVKLAFHDAVRNCVCPPERAACSCGHLAWARLLPRKAIQPTAEELQRNPRSRSARLRVLERL